jgi:hypothetical protein
MKNMIKKLAIVKSCRGSTPIIIICTTLIVILIAAVLSDIGYAAIENYKINKNAEKTAVFGAIKLTQSKSNIESEIRSYAVKNTSELNDLDIKISDNLKDVTVSFQKPFRYLFLQIVGFEEKQIKAKCNARVSAISSFIGVKPFVIQKQKLPYGKEIVLSNKKNGTDSIRIVPINLGESNYKANIIYGYRKTLYTGDGVYYSKKSKSEDLIDALSTILKSNKGNNGLYGSSTNEKSLMIIPVVEKIELAEKKTMSIIGFAAFQVTAFRTEKSDFFISGRFRKRTVKGGTSDKAEDFGLTGIKITH